MRPEAHPALAALLLCTAALHAQAKPSAAVPATQPTRSVSDLPSAHPQVVEAPHGETHVTWNGSQLTIEANGEPMPELLNRVAHKTGMKITGGVPDERIFGQYGPGSVQVVLGQLFDGLPVNMMLVNDTPTRPKELVLTTRTGGPTPPSTRQVAEDTQPQRSAQPLSPAQQQGFLPRPTFQRPSADAQPTDTSDIPPALPPLAPPPAENTAFTHHGVSDASPSSSSVTDTSTTATTSTDNAEPKSPNGVRTPEEIFQELQNRHQQTASH